MTAGSGAGDVELSAANDILPAPQLRLEGAAAVARYLGKPERWVYQARERGWRVPIRKADGIGIYAFADELDAWLRDPSTLSWSPEAARA